MKNENYEDPDFLDLYKIKVQEHWYTMFNPLLVYLGDLKGKKVLDLGCGSGELADKMAKTAKEVVGVDLSQKWIDYCQKKYNQKNLFFLKSDARDLGVFKEKTFDVVIINLVLPHIKTAEAIAKIFTEVRRVLKTGGDFIFSDIHPICKMTKKEGPRKQKYAKDFSYFKDGSEYSAVVILPNKKELEFGNYHWSLEFYVNIINKKNFSLTKLSESGYPAGTPKMIYRHTFPQYITFCCKKLK